MGSIDKRLAGHALIGLDTAVLIYHLEAHPRYLPLTRIVLNGIQSSRWRAVVSTVALMEITVHPWRLKRAGVARQYEVILANFPNLQMAEVTRDVARRAAQLHAATRIRPADALQVATSLVHGATAWVTNDKELSRLGAMIDVIILDEYLDD